MKRFLVVACVMSLSAPLAAQTPPAATPAPAPASVPASVVAAAAPASPASPALPPVAPDRLAAAKPVIDKLWPLGTYRRMMDGTMTKMMDAIFESSFGLKASDVIGPMDPAGKTKEIVGNSTVGELAEKADPAFRERMRITFDVMMKEMVPLMEKLEPTVRTNLTTIYGRRFTVAQLKDMAAFFGTPSGSQYASQSMLLFTDPEMMNSMQSFIPELMTAMPGMMEKAKLATAHLPPLPEPKTDEATENAALDAVAAEGVDGVMSADEAMNAATETADAEPWTDSASWSPADRSAQEKLDRDHAAIDEKISKFYDAATERARARLAKEKK